MSNQSLRRFSVSFDNNPSSGDDSDESGILTRFRRRRRKRRRRISLPSDNNLSSGDDSDNNLLSGDDSDESGILTRFRRRRRRRISLPPNLRNRPSLEEVQIEGEIIYRNFLGGKLEEDEIVEELQVNTETTDLPNQAEVRELLQEVEELRQEIILPARARISEGHTTAHFARTGREIRELADAFSRSVEGRRVRERADEVPLSSITENRFTNLLYEVFLEGFSRERLIALFSYCSRILVRALQEKAYDLSMNLFRWSLEYIRNQVSQWVYQQGGWEKILGTVSWDEILLVGLVVVVLTVFAYFLYNR